MKAFLQFGLPTDAFNKSEFIDNHDSEVFTFGRPPMAIDVMTKVKGLEFDTTYNNSVAQNIEELEVNLISFEDLIAAKKAAKRFKDLNDIEKLEEE